MMVQIMSKTKIYKVRGYAECILTTEILASSREEADELYRSRRLKYDVGSHHIEIDPPYTIDCIDEEEYEPSHPVIFSCPDKIKDDELKVLVDQQVDALLKTF